MALNIAVPMSGVGDLLEGFGLLSPISPVSIDFRMKNPLSPVGSESSGVSSLDLEDIKKQMPTLLDENEEDGTSGAGNTPPNSASLSAATTMSTTSSRTCSTSSSSSSSASDDYTNQLDENEPKLSEKSTENSAPISTSPSAELLGSCEKELNEPSTTTVDDTDALLSLGLLNLTKEPSELPLFSPKTTKEPIFILPRQAITYNNRDILDVGSNIRPQGSGGTGEFAFQFAELPVTNNIQFFLQNRSQYHRLGPYGNVQEFRMETCPCCDFQYPVNAVGANSAAAPHNQTCGTSSLSNLNANQIYGNLQQQQQQQQQQQLRLQQQQLQMQYAYRFNNNNGNSVSAREYNMYQQVSSGIGGNGNAAGGLQSSRFNNGAYGSGNVGSLPNAQNGMGGSGSNGGFFNNNLLGRDQFNHMGPMGMQYNNTGANHKGISQSNGTSSQSSGLRPQQQYDMVQQQQKQYVNNYSLGSAASNSVAMAASANAAVRLQQQQSQQASHYYKKSSSMRYGVAGPAGVNNMPSGGPSGSNWKNAMASNTAIQDTATKLIMELNKMQQQSPYYVPFQ
ncbi:hybrid signal transduction histidine kinase I-like [Anopheles marshallii]|uniref:hybrid signal transduction histidine kinase I-like n=1 Tax=Anopheles marshallii TaxID=1521116 RepID=UPI00237B18EC|nr:hybrid signal transduction histidine kinase I-like [Anopheles marshallii]